MTGIPTSRVGENLPRLVCVGENLRSFLPIQLYTIPFRTYVINI